MAESTWPWSWPKPSSLVLHGLGKWWGQALESNEAGNKEKYPYRCAVPSCSHLYTASGANASRIRWHLLGEGKGIAKCVAVRQEDKAYVRSKSTSLGKAAASVSEDEPSAKRQAVDLIASSAVPTASSSANGEARELTHGELALQEAARVELVRTAGLTGMFKHMLSVKLRDELHRLWTIALVNANLPPSILENDYFRTAIIQTSLAPAPYQPPLRGVMERRLIPAYDRDISQSVQTVMKDVKCRVFGMDGWDDAQRRPLINIMLYSEEGDEFLDDEDMTDQDKDADSLARLAAKHLIAVAKRYPPDETGVLKLPSVFGICTDNPTVMRNARASLLSKLTEHDDHYQPFLFDWPCLLHALSSLLNDLCQLDFIKSTFKRHKQLIVLFRGKQWLRAELGRQQALHKELYKDSRGRFRPLTLMRPCSTRIASLARAAERNVRLRAALEAVCAHPSFFTRCNISGARAAAARAADEEEGGGEGEEDESREEESVSEEGESADEEEDDESEQPMSTAARRQQRFLAVRATIRDDSFWEDTDECLERLGDLLRFIKYSDESRSMIGFVWPMMYSLSKSAQAVRCATRALRPAAHVRECNLSLFALPSVLRPARAAVAMQALSDDYTGDMPLAEREQMHRLIYNRWVYLHSEIHSAAYVLNPRFVDVDHFSDASVRDEFMSVLYKLLPDDMAVSAAVCEYKDYLSKRGLWSNGLAWAQARTLRPGAWWETWGRGNTVWLGAIAPLLLGAAHGAAGAERNFSVQGWINKDRRSKQKPETIARLTRAMTNQKLLDSRISRGKARAAALDRINCRTVAAREKRPVVLPASAQPKPYPLDGVDIWSCDESDDEAGDEQLVNGPMIEPLPSAAQRGNVESSRAARPAPAIPRGTMREPAEPARLPPRPTPRPPSATTGAAAAAGRRQRGQARH